MHKALAILGGLLFGWHISAVAQDINTSQRFGDYEVFYSVFNTDFIAPDIAKTYGIVRAKDRALLNIAVQKLGDDGTMRATAAKIEATKFNLIRRDPLSFQEIREENALYYISEFSIDGREEWLQFTITVTPEGTNKTFTIKFSRRLYAD